VKGDEIKLKDALLLFAGLHFIIHYY